MDTIYGILLSEGLRNFAIIIGVIVAIGSIATARSLARKKQAADMLLASRSIKELQRAAECIEKHHNAPDSNMRALANGDAKTEEVALVRSLLNHFELLSVGIQSGIYDERMIKESWCTIVTRTYDQSLPFIQATRERDNKHTLYQEFELLAKRWKESPLAQKRSWGQSWWRRFF